MSLDTPRRLSVDPDAPTSPVANLPIGGQRRLRTERVIATKTDFAAEEWESMQHGVTGASLLVSLSDRSFFDTFKEAGALGKHIAQAKQNNSSEIVRELADPPRNRVRPHLLTRHGPDRDTGGATNRKDNARVKGARGTGAVEVAHSVANAAGGGETAETGEIE
jgi:hypothetical protein